MTDLTLTSMGRYFCGTLLALQVLLFSFHSRDFINFGSVLNKCVLITNEETKKMFCEQCEDTHKYAHTYPSILKAAMTQFILLSCQSNVVKDWTSFLSERHICHLKLQSAALPQITTEYGESTSSEEQSNSEFSVVTDLMPIWHFYFLQLA